MQLPSDRNGGRPPERRPSRRDRGTLSGGILASVLLHVLLILAWKGDLTRVPQDALARPSPRFLHMSIPIPTIGPPEPTRAVRRPELPRPTRAGAPLRTAFERIAVPPSVLPSIPSVEVEPPRETPTNGEAGGGGGANAGPVPVSILPNWRPPTAAIGMEVVARVLVTAAGEATGSVELRPPTPDRGFNRRIADRVMRLDYRPALRDGTPIADWAEISFVFCKTTVVATSPPSVNRRGRPCAPRDP